jgi:hypothetical protein
VAWGPNHFFNVTYYYKPFTGKENISLPSALPKHARTPHRFRPIQSSADSPLFLAVTATSAATCHAAIPHVFHRSERWTSMDCSNAHFTTAARSGTGGLYAVVRHTPRGKPLVPPRCAVSGCLVKPDINQMHGVAEEHR